MYNIERITKLVTEEINKITEALKTSPIIDDHTGKELEHTAIGIARLVNGNFGLVLDTEETYCLNSVYLSSDNKVYLSDISIGGNITGKLDIEEYNNNCYYVEGKISSVLYFINENNRSNSYNIHNGPFETQEEFDKFFNDPNAILEF